MTVLTDVRALSRAPWPEKRATHQPTPTTDRCPECQRGRVVQVSSDPRAVQYVCSRRCGWDA
jgi:hypothetical protein